MEYLSNKWNILVIPMSSCGMPGYIRVSYGFLRKEECKKVFFFKSKNVN